MKKPTNPREGTEISWPIVIESKAFRSRSQKIFFVGRAIARASKGVYRMGGREGETG